MTRVRRYSRATTLIEASAARRADPAASWLAGGTILLAGDRREKPESVIDVGAALPRGVERRDGALVLGAGATFQEIAESALVPAFLVEAVLTMANRNTRNRATLGGNLAADKSCSSLVPILIALGSEVEVLSPESSAVERLGLESWLREREAGLFERASALRGRGAQIWNRSTDLVLRVILASRPGRRAAYRRWNRVSCDISVIGAAVAYELDAGKVRGLRLALGGLGPKARRFPEIEALFELASLPSREKIEEMIAPRLEPIDDLRASAAFKRLRGAQLAADALREAAQEELP